MQWTACPNTKKEEHGVNHHTSKSTWTQPGFHLEWSRDLLVGRDVSLAESVVIHMRYAAIKEMYLNTEVQKPSLEEILQFQGPRMDFTVESTPHPDAQACMSACERGEVMQKQQGMGLLLRSRGNIQLSDKLMAQRYGSQSKGNGIHHTEEKAHTPEARTQGNRFGPIWWVLLSNFFWGTRHEWEGECGVELGPMAVTWVRQ